MKVVLEQYVEEKRTFLRDRMGIQEKELAAIEQKLAALDHLSQKETLELAVRELDWTGSVDENMSSGEFKSFKNMIKISLFNREIEKRLGKDKYEEYMEFEHQIRQK